MIKISMIIYDFDGVMTNNKAYLNESGVESVQINRADGLGIELIRKLGIKQMILSTEKNKVVRARAKKLKIPVIHGVENKLLTFKKYCNDNNILNESIAFIGNDINDKDVMIYSGLSLCPKDAYTEIKKISDHILDVKGGDGVVRDMFNFIINNEKIFSV